MIRNWCRPLFLPLIGLLLCAVFARESASQDKPAPPKADRANGKIVFEANCAECHYADETDSLVGPGLKGIKNGKLPSGRDATREAILSTVNEGVDEMPPFRERLKASEKEDVIAYVLSL